MVWWKNPCFICLCVWEIFIKRKTSIALQLHVFALREPYVAFMTQMFTHMCPVVPLSFIKLFDPSEMPFMLVWSRSHALNQLNFYTGSQLCQSIHPQNKTPCLIISLSSILQMRHGLFKKKRKKREKRWHAQEAWPKKMDTSISMEKRKKNI